MLCDALESRLKERAGVQGRRGCGRGWGDGRAMFGSERSADFRDRISQKWNDNPKTINFML